MKLRDRGLPDQVERTAALPAKAMALRPPFGPRERIIVPKTASADRHVKIMLTSGRHFRAIYHVLRSRLPGAQVIGLFITRRVRPDDADF